MTMILCLLQKRAYELESIYTLACLLVDQQVLLHRSMGKGWLVFCVRNCVGLVFSSLTRSTACYSVSYDSVRQLLSIARYILRKSFISSRAQRAAI